MIGLVSEELARVREILAKHLTQHLPDVEAWAFRSRITPHFKPWSDLDLAIITKAPLTPRELALLANDFSESELPFKVDLIDWSMASPEFQALILKNRERVL
jgi:uncharacterized protein